MLRETCSKGLQFKGPYQQGALKLYQQVSAILTREVDLSISIWNPAA